MAFPDLPSILAAILLAPVLLLAPGYFWTRLADIDAASSMERAAWSLLLSLATVPALSYNFFLVCPYNARTIWMFAAVQAALPALLWWRLRSQASAVERAVGRGSARLAFGRLWVFPVLMAGLVLICLMDLERGPLLYRGYPAGDYSKHIFVADAIHRTGLPPVNPVFHPGRPLLLFYYFFWHLVCSIVDGLSGWRLGPRAVAEGMTAWAAAALFAVVLVLAVRFLRPVTRRTILVCWSLLFVTGLDLIGFLLAVYLQIEPGRIAWRSRGVFPGAVDSWNWVGQVTSWMETAMWAPQHLASAVVSMTAFALVFGLRPGTSAAARNARILLLAAAFASSLGLSVWVALVFGAFWLVWGGACLWRRSRESIRVVAPATIVALFLAAPFVYALSLAWLHARAPLAVGVRQFGFWEGYSENLRPGGWKTVLDLAWLGPVYFVELGIFLVGGVFWWKYHRRPLEEPEAALAMLAAVSIVLTSVVRSNVRYNDFGWRGTLPAQFVLLLWTGWMLERLWRRRRFPPLVVGCLAMGLFTTGYDWVWMRSYGMAMDLIHHKGFSGRHAWAFKRLYQQIAASTPPDTIIQGNPNVWLEPHQSFAANRQSVVLDRVHGTLFGTEGPLFERTMSEVTAIFNGHLTADQIVAVARQYDIGVLVVRDTDAAWHSHVWDDRSRFRPLAACDFGRAYQPIYRAERSSHLTISSIYKGGDGR